MLKRKLRNGVVIDSMLLTFVRVIVTVFSFVIVKLLSTQFSLTEYGTYSQALLISTTATSLSILGLTDAATYWYNKPLDDECKRRYMATIFGIQVIVGGCIGIGIIICQNVFIEYFDNEVLRYYIPVIAFIPLLTNLLNMYHPLFVSVGKAKMLAVKNLVVTFCKLMSVIIACFVLEDVVAILITMLVIDIIQVIYFSHLFGRYGMSINIRKADKSLVREILAFSLPMAIYVFTNSLARDMDKLVISAFMDTESLAIYTNASKQLPFDMVTASIITVLIPVLTQSITRKENERAKKAFKAYLRIGFVITFILVAGVIATAKEWILMLYDEKYLPGMSVFIIYLIVDMIRFANITTVLMAAGKTKLLMIVSVGMLALNMLLNVVAVQFFGMLGPAVVTLALNLVMITMLIYSGAKEIDADLKELFNLKEIFIVSVEMIVVGWGVHYLTVLLENMGCGYMLRLVISYGIYILVMGIANYRRIISCFRELNQVK